MRRPLLALALSLSLYGTATAGPVILTLAGDATVATGITGLVIPGAPGVIYDVDFTRAGESFNAIFGLGDPPSGGGPAFYDWPSLAEEMRDAIKVAFAGTAFVKVGDLDGTSIFIDVPTRSDIAPINNYVSYGDWVYDVSNAAFNVASYRDGFGEASGTGVFSIQSAVIPEPSSVTLALMGALGLLGYGWRRKRKRANSVS